MTEALITELARVGAWRITSRTSSMAYKGKALDLPSIARQLGVDGVIEGSVMHAGDRVKVTVQLLDARADRHLWAESFERSAADVLLLQSEIAGAVARQVSVELRAGPAAARHRVDPAAYDAYLRGRFFWNKRTREGFEKALAEFRRATTLDPEWAPGWAGLADTYGLMAISTYDLMPPAQAMPQARDAAKRALALDDGLAEAHTALAWVNYTYDWNFTVAEREFRRAVELDPNYATAHQWYSNYLCAMGRLAEAQA
jgi:tetratricopeptide (TPR) repeat protein